MANSPLDPQLMKMLRGEGFTNLVPSTFNFNDNCILLIIILSQIYDILIAISVIYIFTFQYISS